MHGESRTNPPPGDAAADDRTTSAGATPDDAGAPQGSVVNADAAPPDPLAEIARLKDSLLRTAADFDNFRKRTRREIEEARRSAQADLLRAMLPVFDNLERAIQSAQRTSDVKAMTEGLTMVQRQFGEAIGREGIARVPTVGKSFDPNVHEAIQQVETSDHAPGTVIAEVQPGYTQGERLLRAAMVVVARPKAGDAASGHGSGETN